MAAPAVQTIPAGTIKLDFQPLNIPQVAPPPRPPDPQLSQLPISQRILSSYSSLLVRTSPSPLPAPHLSPLLSIIMPSDWQQRPRPADPFSSGQFPSSLCRLCRQCRPGLASRSVSPPRSLPPQSRRLARPPLSPPPSERPRPRPLRPSSSLDSNPCLSRQDPAREGQHLSLPSQLESRERGPASSESPLRE